MKHKHTLIHSFLFLFFFFFFLLAYGTTITVVNECGFSIWPGIYSSHVLNITGFELKEGNSRSFQTPANWSGIVWGRTGCTFNGSDHGSCQTGDCGSGEIKCNGRSPTGPFTVAEFDFMEEIGDFYNVNLTNGYNLQMTVEASDGLVSPSHDCKKTGCVYDLNKRCPMELRLAGGGGCKSPCQVFGTPEYCCDLYSTTPCNPSYWQLFDLACPRSFYRANIFTGEYSCERGNYTVRFCPPDNTFSMLKVGNKLSYTEQLFSRSGNITLGFFGENRYLGIWYTRDSEARKVWVANPNKPIVSKTGLIVFSIDVNTGDLIITDGTTTLVNITDVQAGPNPNVTATLEDNGNLRLINEIDKMVLWQSFDHPTNVLLPGMKLGYDNKTSQNKNWTLTSWLSDEIPDSGSYTLSWEFVDETYQRFVIRQRGQPYWTSGFLDVKTFEYMLLLDEDRRSNYILTSVYNNEQQYLSYIDDPAYEDAADPFPMWILTPNGRIANHNISNAWTPEWCYGYNSSNGCMDSGMPLCRGADDYFNYRKGEFDPHKTRDSTDSNSSLSISDCFVKCWNDCSCVGFNSSNINGTGCVFWTGRNKFFVDEGDNSTMKYVIRSRSPDNTSTEKNMKPLWTLTVVPLFLGLGLLWYMKKQKHKRKQKEYKIRKRDECFLELAASASFNDIYQLESDGRYGDLLLFSFASIMAATRDFSAENKLGQGGFGPVYKGRLSDGREIAIKRLSRTSGQGLVEFKNELILIAKLQHTNLVRILGCCIHGEERMLVYEYMPNKSLDFFLFDENRKAELDWPKRFNIIEGIAQGLLYLHKYSRMRVIHRDLKSNNILLDESMNPKISDFGMARMFNQNETQATTNRVVGTYGYMSPEYAMEGTFSIKSDIYSFGVLILEILSGRRNSSFLNLDRTSNLLSYAWELWQQGNEMELLDEALESTCVEQQFLRIFHVALLCVQERAIDRPMTSDMISMLLSDTISLPTPKGPAFLTRRVDSFATLDQIKPEDCSVNDMTITVVDGR